LSTTENLVHFAKFRQKWIFSSRPPFFLISSVFRQKWNPLELNDNTSSL